MEKRISDIKDLNENEAERILYRKICIFGQGFVGLPLALSFALNGCNVLGVDVDDILVDNLNKGITHHTEKYNHMTIQEILKIQLEEKRYKATTDSVNAVRACKNILVTVGIPVKDGKFKMDYLENACRVIGRNLKKEDVVIIRSTVIPGTTEEFILPVLEEESGMKAGKDFYLAYSSERIAEGKAFDEIADMPTLVAGINEKSCERAVDLLMAVCKTEVIKASCIKAVETSKVFENVQRDVNIAVSHEFARFAEALGIDIFEVVKLANTHKRVNLLIPGPGVGGYCIPNAYHYLAPKAKEMDVDMELLRLSREKNAAVPMFIADKVQELLYEQGKDIKGSKIAVLGLAMKDFSNDDRMSPPVDICKLLIEKGAKVSAFDPVVPTVYCFKTETMDEALKDAEAVLLLTKQCGIEFDDFEHISKLLKEKAVFVDTKAMVNKEEVLKHGIKYWRI